MKTPDLSIVIPVYNSEDILENLYSCLNKALAGKFSYEVVFVNDCSKDNSWDKIKALSETIPVITGVNLRKNSGQDNALIAGLQISRGSYVVIMDDDLQHNPEDIESLYNECRKGFDVVYANFRHREQNYFKKAGSDLSGKVAEILINKPKNIYLSPFKIMKREVAKEIIKYAGPYPYIDGIILTVTSSISQIDVKHQKRATGCSNYSYSRSISVFLKLFTGFSVIPLRIATIAGLIATGICFLLSLKYLYDYFIAEDFVEGWTTIVILIMLFGGLILMTLGIIGEYIGRTYLTINNKPAFTISEIVNVAGYNKVDNPKVKV